MANEPPVTPSRYLRPQLLRAPYLAGWWTLRTIATEHEVDRAVGSHRASALVDSQVWSTELENALEALGYQVKRCYALDSLLARRKQAGLIVVAQQDPVGAVRACRLTPGLDEAPLMVVVAHEGDLVPTLDAGADDAVVSGVDPIMFMARVRALLRRTRLMNGRRTSRTMIRDLVIDFEEYEVSLAGRALRLTPTEFRLLAVLAQQAGRVVDPRALLSTVHRHDYHKPGATNLVKAHIANLRIKMSDSGRQNPYILTIRGFGYMLNRRELVRQGDPDITLTEA
jgi:DNA-binding response OmpR family regulator